MNRARCTRSLLLALLLATCASAPARAAVTVTWDGGQLELDGGSEASLLTVDFEPHERAAVHDDAGTLAPGRGCLGTSRDVSCALPSGPECHPHCVVSIALGGGDDALIARVYGGHLATVDLGAGDDRLHMVGGAEAIATGGPGRDLMRADKWSQFDGGEGADVTETPDGISSYAKRAQPIRVTLDGLANDGAPGEGDNVRTPIVWGGDAGNVLIGDDGRNWLYGGSGDDVIVGGAGDDMIAPWYGADRVDAGAGADVIDAGPRSQPGDEVRCGSGHDLARRLPVSGPWTDCEVVFGWYTGPLLSVSKIWRKHGRPTVTIGWPPQSLEPRETRAFGKVKVVYRGRTIGSGSFRRLANAAEVAVRVTLSRRGRRLACAHARPVRLLVLAGAPNSAYSSYSTTGEPKTLRVALRRRARLPKLAHCTS